ncbi:hypothetical protein D3C87_1958560 [compost metagenome]
MAKAKLRGPSAVTQVTPTPTELAILLKLISLHLVLDFVPSAFVVSEHDESNTLPTSQNTEVRRER